MGGVKTTDMKAQSTQETKTKPCAHTKQTQTHLHQNYHKPCAWTRQDTNTQLMRLLISRSFAQEKTTWNHVVKKTTSCMLHSTRHNMKAYSQKHELRTTTQDTRTEEHMARANLRPHAHTTEQNMEREGPNQNWIWARHEYRDLNTML